jgi:hypothetical protein
VLRGLHRKWLASSVWMPENREVNRPCLFFPDPACRRIKEF